MSAAWEATPGMLMVGGGEGDWRGRRETNELLFNTFGEWAVDSDPTRGIGGKVYRVTIEGKSLNLSERGLDLLQNEAGNACG